MKKLFALLLIGCLLVAPLSVSAANTASQDGLSVSIATDKDTYGIGEEVAVTVTLKNDGDRELADIQIETLLPDSLTLKDGSLMEDVISLKPGESKVEVVTGTVKDPKADTALSIADAIALGASKAHDTYTSGKYYVTGVITEVYNTQYGYMKLTDEAGNILDIYGTYSTDGSTRYDALEVKLVAGDTVTIYGIVGQYNGTPQIKNGWITAHTAAGGDTPVDPPADPDAPETGDSRSDGWVIALLVVSAAALVVAVKYKKGVQMMSLLLCCTFALGVIPVMASAKPNDEATLTVDKEITVNGEKCTIQANVKYTVVYSEIEIQKAKLAELLETKHKLTYNEDGSFRVLIIADAHMNVNGDATDVQEVKDRIKFLVDTEDPDLVIYTGDNTINSWSEQELRDNLDAIVSYVEEKKIPWCHVYGNHDEEYGMSKERQQAVYESYEYCVSKAGPDELFGVGNYVLGVYKADGSIGSVIYCLDSGAYASGGGYDYIKDNQVAWYKETSELLQACNGGTVVPALMAFHIPLYENRLAYINRNNKDIVSEWDGERNEDICSSNSDMNNMFETMLERGDVKAVVTGHDHINDYMFNYYGIKLCSSPNISDLIYYDARVQGARSFDLNLDTIDNIPTHVTYIIPR